jgi:hypothetical protein
MPGRVVEISGARLDLASVRRLPGVSDAQVFGDRVHATLVAGDDPASDDDAAVRLGAALLATPMAGARVRVIPPSLEDVFIARLTRDEAAS